MKSKLLLAVILLASLGCHGFTPGASSREQADRLARDGKYDEAIDLYRKHLETRLAAPNRPDWDNPYIYLLDIGDMHLKKGEPENAIKYYELAEQHKVEAEYVTDHLRGVALWYEERGLRLEALQYLKKYRRRDPLMFDLMLDRIAHDIVAAEENEK